MPREYFPPVTINVASVRIVGIPGLSLVLIVVAIAVQFPEARWLLVSGVAAGAIVAAMLVSIRHRRPMADAITHIAGPQLDRRGLR